VATVPTPGDGFDSPGVLDATDLNEKIVDVLNFLLNKPAAELRMSTTQSIPNNSYTALTFDTEDLDDDPAGTGGHSTSSNTTRYTAVYAGWYEFSGGCGFAASATGLRGLRWAKNGSAVNAAEAFYPPTASSTPIYPARTKKIFLNVGDYVELQVFQTSGGALNTTGSSTDQPSMSVKWVRQA
jgi:hypothetical protein